MCGKARAANGLGWGAAHRRRASPPPPEHGGGIIGKGIWSRGLQSETGVSRSLAGVDVPASQAPPPHPADYPRVGGWD